MQELRKYIVSIEMAQGDERVDDLLVEEILLPSPLTEREVKTLGTMIKRYGAEATKRRQKKIEELEAKAAKLREEVASMA